MQPPTSTLRLRTSAGANTPAKKSSRRVEPLAAGVVLVAERTGKSTLWLLMSLNQVELDGFAIHHHFDHAAAVERPPALGNVHTADDIFDGDWIFQGVAGALDLADVLGVEGELAQLTVGLDEVD